MKTIPEIVVAMSGGVDSSCAAFLLSRDHKTVRGVTLWMYEGISADRAIEDAKAVCGVLGIAHTVVDIRKSYEQQVIEPFCEAYLSGLTPNPCLECNPNMKWTALMACLEDTSTGYVATGHFARIEEIEPGKLALRRGVSRDQSYFLSRLTARQIARTLFPVGHLTKDEIRMIAARAGLPVAQRPDSQEVCFISDKRYDTFIRKRIPDSDLFQPGEIRDTEGRLLGYHKGLFHYTTGQRQGLGVAAGYPLYVIKKDVRNNQLIVGVKEKAHSTRFRSRSTVWSAVEEPLEPLEALCQIRYLHTPVPCVISPENPECGIWRVELTKTPAIIAPGQGVSFYRDDFLLGGGEIALDVENK